ncbi:MAG: hypothetical protein Fur0019_02430 [Tibeticola sp.]
MVSTRPIALFGLSPTERVLLSESLFPEGGSPIPGAVQVDSPLDAWLVIADARNADALRTLQHDAPQAKVLLLGTSDAGTGWPVIARPLRLHAVIEAAKLMLVHAEADSPETPVGGAPAPVAAVLQPVNPEPPRPPDPPPVPIAPVAADSHDTVPGPAAPSAPRLFAPAHGETTGFEDTRVVTTMPSVVPSDWEDDGHAPVSEGSALILVVSQPGTATGGLLRILKSSGYTTEFAADPEAALRQMSRKRYAFVFLIEVSLGPAAITLCRRIGREVAPAARPSRVIVISDHRRWWPRLRAWLAGCDTWLQVPLHRASLLAYLRR